MSEHLNLIFITVDCLRADHVGFLGYDRPTTPFLDKLSQESLLFERAFVAGMPTYYSFPAIMAARYPLSLGRDVVGVAPAEPTLATTLKESGYATAAFLAGNPYLSRRFHYHQGFDDFEDFLISSDWMSFDGQNHQGKKIAEQSPPPRRRRLNQALQRVVNLWAPARALYNELYFHYNWWISGWQSDGRLDALRQYPAADVVVDAALTWWRQQQEEPFFLWLHLMDPHHPYYPPTEALASLNRSHLTGNRARYLNGMWNRGNQLSNKRLKGYCAEVMALYDAGIRWVDEQVKRLVQALQEGGIWDKTLFVLTGDHGEEFLEHGGRYHHPIKLPQELLHVPLLMRLPSGILRQRLPDPFSLIDLAPTLLSILDIVPPDSFVGQSRWQGSRVENDSEGLAITECVHDCRNPWHPKGRLGARLLAVQDQQYKLLLNFATNEEHLFDLQRDPNERTPLPASLRHPVRQRLLAAALDHLRHSQPHSTNQLRLQARLADLKHLLASDN